MATAQLNTRTVTETQMVDWATASAEASKAAGDAPYDIILKATKDAIVRAGHEVSDAQRWANPPAFSTVSQGAAPWVYSIQSSAQS